MTAYNEWRKRHPQAAAELDLLFIAAPPPVSAGPSEGWAQQQVRMDVARQGALAWRNNVGALKDERGVPVRYGLCNDSASLNERIKSSDLILCIPRVIRPEHVGTVIGQFGSVECKRPGWEYKGTKHEQAQQAWLTIISRAGGFACFSTGTVELPK